MRRAIEISQASALAEAKLLMCIGAPLDVQPMMRAKVNFHILAAHRPEFVPYLARIAGNPKAAAYLENLKSK